MKEHAKKIIAPALIILYIMLQQVVSVMLAINFIIPVIAEITDISVYVVYLIKIFSFIIPTMISYVCIRVFVERIKEIRSGEEDDLSKY